MSKPRQKWWSYMKAAIRAYPAQKRAMERDPLSRFESRTEEREFRAVEAAIAATSLLPNGRDRLLVVRCVLWEQSHSLQGAALLVPCAFSTARRWHSDFIALTGQCFGLGQ